VCCFLPLLPGIPPYWTSLLAASGISAIVVLGLVVLTGIAGMTSFAQAGFFGVAAYMTALLSTSGWSPWLALPVAIAASGLTAFVLGSIALRLSGHYLALATIAWAVALDQLFANLDFLGRNDGISGIPPLSLFGLRLIDNRAYCVLVWLVVLSCVLATIRLLDSRVGRGMRALRTGAQAAASFGVNLAAMRLLAFVYAALLAGLGGFLYAHMQRSVNPTPFGLSPGIIYLLMAVVGGAAHIPGAVLGAVLVSLGRDRLQDLLQISGASGSFEDIAFGVLMLLVLQRAPEGLWPLLFRWWREPKRLVAGSLPLAGRPMPQPAMRLLQVDGLQKRFGGLLAVQGLSFVIDVGEIVGLIGPNGAGKSTSFNLLTGVDRPSAGSVRFAGQVITGRPSSAVAALRIARSFQHVRLVDGMSVIENVALGAHLRGRAGALGAILRRDRGEEAAIFAEAARQLARVGLAEEADKAARALPLGQQRLVEIARALCLDPVLLLLDEPAAGLRLHEKQALAAMLTQLRSEGLSILLVEHDMDFVMRLADRLVVLNFGTLLAEGPPASVARNPEVIEAYLGGVA
jgi:branched-chain amino acid transport system permease protein